MQSRQYRILLDGGTGGNEAGAVFVSVVAAEQQRATGEHRPHVGLGVAFVAPLAGVEQRDDYRVMLSLTCAHSSSSLPCTLPSSSSRADSHPRTRAVPAPPCGGCSSGDRSFRWSPHAWCRTTGWGCRCRRSSGPSGTGCRPVGAPRATSPAGWRPVALAPRSSSLLDLLLALV